MNKKLVIDLDDTISFNYSNDYSTATVNLEVLNVLRTYKSNGFTIVINTSRNMRTHGGNIGLINANTLPVIVDWLKINNIPFDEVYIGKPWCGEGGFYVDDKAIRPAEFVHYSYEEILDLLKKDNMRT